MTSLYDDTRRDLTPILAPFPRKQQYLLSALQAVQKELGQLPPWALLAVGEHLRVPPSELYGVATHFPELRLERRGEHVVRVCTGLSCAAVGGGEVLAAVEQRLGVRIGEARPDGRVSLEETTCAFICSVAPIVEIDGVAYGGLQPEDAAALVERQVWNGVVR